MEQSNHISPDTLFKTFAQSIKSNDISTFAYLTPLIEKNNLKAYFTYQLQHYAEVDYDNVSLLYHAVSHQNYAITKFLLELGANPNEISGMLLSNHSHSTVDSLSFFSRPKDENIIDFIHEESPFVLAAMLKNRDLVYLLLSYGADPIICETTSRLRDMDLSEAQRFVINVRDAWLIEQYQLKIQLFEKNLASLPTLESKSAKTIPKI